MERAEVVDYYKELSETYEKKRLSITKDKIISDLQNDWFIRNLDGTMPARCLEIGCGTGRLTRSLIQKTRILVAVDTSLEMIRINRERTMDYSPESEIHYVISDASHLPFRSNKFAAVAGARVFWHIADYQKALKEAYRTLEVHGLLLFDFPRSWGPLSLYSRFRSVKHDVLMLFTEGKIIKKMFKKARNVIIRGNFSIALYLVPNGMLKIEPIRRLIYTYELLDNCLSRSLTSSYYLVKVTK